jgi:hypothetical protein
VPTHCNDFFISVDHDHRGYSQPAYDGLSGNGIAVRPVPTHKEGVVNPLTWGGHSASLVRRRSVMALMLPGSSKSRSAWGQIVHVVTALMNPPED